MVGRIGLGGLSGNQFVTRHNQANKNLNESMLRLSTGKRINKAKDDPAGLISAVQIQAELTGLEAQQRAASSQAHFDAIIESSNGQVSNVLNQIYGLVTQAGDGLLSGEQRSALQVEIDEAIDSVSRIQQYTQKYQSGGGPDLTALRQLQSAGDLNVVNGDVGAAQEVLKDQISSLAFYRAEQGAKANANDALSEVRDQQMINQTEALSQVQDLDFAKEISNLRRSQTLVQSSLLALQYHQQNAGSSVSSLLGGLNLQA